jgi:formate dehydrogenase subunit gamma
MPDPTSAVGGPRDARTVPLAELVHSAVREYAGEPGPLLPVLHRLQQLMGFIHPDAIPLLASELNLSRADVQAVVRCYRDLRDRAEGRLVRICAAEPCQSAGAQALMNHARITLAAVVGEPTADGRYRLDQVFCLGICASGPAAEIDGTVHGRVSPDRFDELIGRRRP